MKKWMMGCVLATVVAGCVTVDENDGGDSAIAPNVIKDTIRVKYAIGNEAVQATDNINCLFGFITWGSTATHEADLSDVGFGGVGKAMSGAYANACDAANCDALDSAQYRITTTNDYFVFKKIKVEVVGYPVNLIGAEVIPAEKTDGFSQGGVENAGTPSESGGWLIKLFLAPYILNFWPVLIF